MNHRARVTVAAAATALAVGCGGGALWIEAKALLAQFLLERAWSQTAKPRDRVKPWPWADTWPVARLSVPRLGERWIVLAGASGRTLAFGPGHLDGSALPGERGHAVLAGHRDTQFSALRGLRLGDELVVETPAQRVVRYQVSGLEILDKSALAAVTAAGDDTLTLVTCWPFDAVVPGGALRYVVTAERTADGRRTLQRAAIN